MTDFLDWEYIDADSIILLEACADENEIKRLTRLVYFSSLTGLPLSAQPLQNRLLHEMFHVANYKVSKQAILVDYHFYNYA